MLVEVPEQALDGGYPYRFGIVSEAEFSRTMLCLIIIHLCF